MNKSESKYFNTAVRMDEALLSLLEKKDFEYITVKELCDKANVHRSTFYLHYENTADLLNESIDYMQKKFLSYFNEDSEKFIENISVCPKKELILIVPKYLTPYLTFIYDNRKLFSAVMHRPSDFRAYENYRMLFRNIFIPILNRFDVAEDEHSYRIAYYINGIKAVIDDWLSGGCVDTIEKIIAIIESCIFPNIWP